MESVWELNEGFSPVIVRKFSESLAHIENEEPKPRKINFKIPMLTSLLFAPTTAFATANSADTFVKIYTTVMTIFDHGVVLLIIFAGASWMLGHRGKAIEYLMCIACGYLLALHAIDIRDFLKGL